MLHRPMANGLLRKSVQVGRRKLLERHLGASSQLGDDLTCTERSQFPATLQLFPLGVGMQETTGVQIAGTGGVNKLTEVDDADVQALLTAEHHGTLTTSGDGNHVTASPHSLDGAVDVFGLVQRLSLIHI